MTLVARTVFGLDANREPPFAQGHWSKPSSGAVLEQDLGSGEDLPLLLQVFFGRLYREKHVRFVSSGLGRDL